MKEGNSMTDLAQNKSNVIAFYELMFNECQPRDAIERYARRRLHSAQPTCGDR